MDSRLAALLRKLYGLGGQYVKDVMPGGSLNPEWTPERTQAALSGMMDVTPVVGDVKSAYEGVQAARQGDIVGAGLGALGALPFVPNMAGIGKIVYHGSPHKFDKFDMSKIGTGEGAQAYGHGLYMAESQDVAKSYADDLTKMRVQAAQSQLKKYGGNVDEAIEALRKEIDRLKSLNLTPATGAAKRDSLIAGQEEKLAELMAYKNQGSMNQGHTYKVDIPDEAVARFLDWDKPLSQQAPEVQKALSNTKNKQLRAMVEYAKVPYSEMAGGEAKTMGEAFRLLNLNLQGKSSADSAKASALLAKQGIPGIRYLDGGSRSAGHGSSNFVLFDDQMARILERNGEATGLKPWSSNEWDGLSYRDPFTK